MGRYEKRIDRVLEQAKVLPLRWDRSYVLMSDCHRGDGNWNDNFAHNKTIYLAALQEYYDKGFVYLELGDGDELWENRNMAEILEKHGEVFALLKCFYCEQRLYMLYGNHDLKKKKGLLLPCFPDIPVYESIFLEKEGNWREEILHGREGRRPEDALGSRGERDPSGREKGQEEFQRWRTDVLGNERKSGILLMHGHQGDLWNERLWYLTRFLVRYLWRPLEQLGVKDPTSAAKNYRKKERVEKRMAQWAKKNHQALIAGHTHRPYFSKEGDEGWYFNSGSGIHPYSVTALEIVRGRITLVKWCQAPDCNQYVRVEKEVLAGPLALEQLFS